MEYIIGPVVALLFAAKFSTYQMSKCADRVKVLEERLVAAEEVQKLNNQELPKKMIAAMMPITKAVKTLNEEVGIGKVYN